MPLGPSQPWETVREDLINRKKGDYAWKEGRLPSYIYFHNDELLEKQREAYGLYLVENGLGKGRAFPSLKIMEDEIFEMSISLLGGGANADAIFASGGTESIMIAVKAARERARTRPELIAPYKIVLSETAHPAFNRAAHLMDIEVVRLPMDPDSYRADVAAIEAAIDEHTIMLVGSAPHYASGTFDPIPELAALAQKRGLWMHVDACVGGFLAPFARMNGHHIPDMDLSVPGVTSLSADIHKYGFAAKGASLLLFANKADRAFGTFAFTWARGTYATDSMQGTRAGGSVACAWAMMKHLGIDGYRELAAITIDTTKRLTDGIDAIKGLKTVRPFELCLFSYCSEDPELDINAVADAMETRGWFIGRSQRPCPSIQMAVNPVHDKATERYLNDLADSAAEVYRTNAKGEFIDGTY
ncbi:pyridoxal phosphate-dependent decarboxylase family protein [Mesorhizobium sp. L48C026A00]|uniref:pyridoxal phosphate-dependent decarboxylase family protein n=1 Tax=Mesorhizobium sp. L48C026A00 TaxID=1287182 RepID=UPI0003D04207|nr:aminotransferase class V-fold PLP-dependent enzyme [Mesorhizobium sp. L48C026A00]ESZ02030.1 hypothetical protein X737_38695 [Mesorhizobium sp. L48C026A00]